MISTMEYIGKLFLKIDDVIEFKKEFNKLYSLVDYNNLFFYKFFNSSFSDRNQFESFIYVSLFFFKDFSEDALPLLNMVKTYCIPLALKINFILWVLNNYICNGEIVKLIDLPYKDIFEKFDQKCHLDDDESEYYKNAIKSYFYILKEIIFEVILFDKISIYYEENVLKFFESNSLISGDNFDIKMIHASINNMHIIKIDYEDCQKYAWISSIIINHNQKKGKIIRIKGEFINDGFGKYSKNMNFCSEKIDKLKGFTLFPI